MRHFRLALVVFASALGLVRVHAQDDEKDRPPPVEIPDFSNLDDYVYVSKSTVTLGYRLLSGAKTRFFGSGHLVSATDSPGAATGTNVDRIYHDGAVHPDTRSTTRVDSDGNTIVDPATGGAFTDPVAPDGRTNSWNYTDLKQQTADGNLNFNSYTADINNANTPLSKGARNVGLELAMIHDMGKIGGSRATWGIIAGMSVNDLAAKTSTNVLASITTLTDTYSLNGAPIPDPPYSAPSSVSTTVTDSNGNAVVNSDGSSQTASTDSTTLISSQPISRTSGTSTSATSVLNDWKLHGAYYTLRAGPTVFLPISTRLRANFSFGAALIYSGSTYSVTQTFTPDTGADIVDTSSSTLSRLLPGYFADASLQFDLTERTGFYAGAVFQSAGAYTQTINTDASHYSTRVDLSNQNGLRAGMTIRF